MYSIDKDIIMPRNGAGRPAKYPWATMEMGDSFFVAGATSSRDIDTYHPARKHGHRYKRRVVKGGVRVWRVA